jgi:hypothetical protein
MRDVTRRQSFLTVTLLYANLLGSCATSGPTKNIQSIKTVGIISAIGSEMSFATAGLTGFSSEIKTFPIESWGLDDMIVQRIGTALNGRYQIRPLIYPRAAFSRLETENPITPLNLVRPDPLSKLVQSNVVPQGLDAYIAVVKTKSTFGRGARTVEGIGLINYKTALSSYNQIHALYEIGIVDGQTFEVIKKRTAAPLNNEDITRVGGPSRLVETPPELGPENFDPNDSLRAAITELIQHSLDVILLDLQLST